MTAPQAAAGMGCQRGQNLWAALLVGAHQFRPGQHMTLHGLLGGRLGRLMERWQRRIKGVQLEEIAMPPDRRARATVALAVPVVETCASAGRQWMAALGQAG